LELKEDYLEIQKAPNKLSDPFTFNYWYCEGSSICSCLNIIWEGVFMRAEEKISFYR